MWQINGFTDSPKISSSKTSITRLAAASVVIQAMLMLFSATPVRAQFDPTPEQERRSKQKNADAKRITARQLNLFHRRFIDECLSIIPERFELQYLGLLGTDNGRQNWNIKGHLGLPRDWAVQDQVRLFTVWVSTKPTEITVAKCVLEDTTLYVNVDFVDENRSPTEKLPELEGRSVRDILIELDGEAGPAATVKEKAKE